MAEKETTLTKWTDTEKLALCIGLINASGPPDWKNVKLPAGRTKKACLHVYNSLKKQSGGIALSGQDSAAVPTPRKKADKAITNAKAVTNGGKKRGRPAKIQKSIEAVDAVDDEEDEEPTVKKMKTEDEDMEAEIGKETVGEDQEEC